MLEAEAASHPSSGEPRQPDWPWRFSLLGDLRVQRHGVQLPPPPNRTHALLAHLLLHPHPRGREQLVGALFPDVAEQAARRRLSDLLWLLRRALPELPLDASAQRVCLPRKARWLDVESFRQAAGGEDVASWVEGLALYRGDLLEGLYDEALLEEREALRLQYIRLAHRACDELLLQRRFEQVQALAEALVLAEPYDEKALRTLMMAYRQVGRRGAALAAYEAFLALAADELGVAPEPATQALAQAIRSEGPVIRPGSAPERPGDATPESLFRDAQEALARGDRAMAEDRLERLRSLSSDVPHEEVCLLEVDLALFCEAYDRAARLLASCDAERGPVLVRVAELAFERREPNEALEAASMALMQAHELRDQQAELDALLVLAKAQQHLGQGVQAMRTAGQALSLARERASPEGIARALLTTGLGQFHQGRYDRAQASFYEARATALEHGLRYLLALALRGIRLVQSYTNRLTEAMATLAAELSIWRDLDLQRWEADALEGQALVQDLLGRSADSLRSLEQAFQISQQLDDPIRLAANRYNLACSLLYADDAMAGRAITEAGEALAIFQAHDQPRLEAATMTILGYALWVDGRHQEALAVLQEAYAVSERAGEPARLPELLAYQGLAHLGLGRDAEALDATRRAVLSLAQGTVSDEAVPDVYYAHAMALSANGREDQARGYLTRAYEDLLESAAQLENEARQAFFHHSPSLRRLMRQVYDRGIALAPAQGVITRQVAASGGGRPIQVRWTVDAGPADLALEQAQGPVALRRARLARMLHEAQAQGAAPTVADLAGALGVSNRTVQRDLAALRPTA